MSINYSVENPHQRILANVNLFVSVKSGQNIHCNIFKYIPANVRFAYLLSLIDVYTRKIVGYVFKQSIRQHDVLWLLKNVLPEKTNAPITLRNDSRSWYPAINLNLFIMQVLK